MTLTYDSVAVIPGTSEDEVWVAVLRTLNVASVRCIERFAPRAYDTHADAFFVDCGVAYDSTATATITGLSHLNGLTVSILGDGAVFPNQVVSAGQVTLSATVEKAAVGLPFRYTLKPMRIEQLFANAPSGTSHGAERKIAELTISFMDTLDAQYGADTSNLFDIEWRSVEDYDSPPALYTGDKVAVLDGGFDPEGPIVISGISPNPCTVRAIIADMQVTGA